MSHGCVSYQFVYRPNSLQNRLLREKNTRTKQATRSTICPMSYYTAYSTGRHVHKTIRKSTHWNFAHVLWAPLSTVINGRCFFHVFNRCLVSFVCVYWYQFGSSRNPKFPAKKTKQKNTLRSGVEKGLIEHVQKINVFSLRNSVLLARFYPSTLNTIMSYRNNVNRALITVAAKQCSAAYINSISCSASTIHNTQIGFKQQQFLSVILQSTAFTYGGCLICWQRISDHHPQLISSSPPPPPC